MSTVDPPVGLLAELTHRCPLGCSYCSNPLDLVRRSAELGAAAWIDIFEQAARLGVLHVHLSGGEPAARSDLATIVAGAARAGLYTNLITSGIGLDAAMVAGLAEAGLDHVQLSLQDTDWTRGDEVAGLSGAQARKRAAAKMIIGAGLPLTINAVVHRGNADRAMSLIEEAVTIGARRIELAHVQYIGWAHTNRAVLLPTYEQVRAIEDAVHESRQRWRGGIIIDYVAPDFFADTPKPCMNGWGRRSLNVTPSGLVLPCHAAQTIPDLEFWNVRDHSLEAIWLDAPAFNAFRGTDWMREPCRSCSRKTVDFGGCRCQAYAMTGNARNADPVCRLSPFHPEVETARAQTREDRHSKRGFRLLAAEQL